MTKENHGEENQGERLREREGERRMIRKSRVYVEREKETRMIRKNRG